jgi:hypothetical protein
MKLIMENWRKFVDEDEAKNKDGKDECVPMEEGCQDQECPKCSGEDPEADSLEEKLDKESMPCNEPRTTSSHKNKSHVVKACQYGKEKIIPFGEKGASTAGKPKKGESDKMKAKRKSFKSRHAKNIKKGKMSAAYWADKVKW